MAKTATAKVKNRDLPGMEDRAIKPLEEVAAAYAEVRDERMRLNTREAELKTTALRLMRKYDKVIYRRDGITITVTEGEPDVKVRVKKPGELEAGDDDDPDGTHITGEDAEA